MVLHIIWSSTASDIFYVIPDNPGSLSCPFQPCATLTQYSLDNNGTLPVVSNVQYRFLPGEHYVNFTLSVQRGSNISLIGTTTKDNLLPVVLVDIHKSYISVNHSINVTIAKLSFREYVGNVIKIVRHEHGDSETKFGLFVFDCYSCSLVHLHFWGCRFTGVNMIGEFLLSNVFINVRMKPNLEFCTQSVKLIYRDIDNYGGHVVKGHNVLVAKSITISGSNKCQSTDLYSVMEIELEQMKYNVTVILSSSKFYHINQPILHINIPSDNNSTVWILNCIFKSNTYSEDCICDMISILIHESSANLTFKNCIFSKNRYMFNVLSVVAHQYQFLRNCKFPTNITFDQCMFSRNEAPLIDIHGGGDFLPCCRPNIILTGYVNFTSSSLDIYDKFTVLSHLIQIHFGAFYVNGIVTVSKNHAERLMILKSTIVLVNREIYFVQNRCDTVLHLVLDFTYISMEKFAKVVFYLNFLGRQLIDIVVRDQIHYPYCVFQYIDSKNASTNHSFMEYQVLLINNVLMLDLDYISYTLLSHCKWLTTTVFHNYHPKVINQQIIKIDNQQWYHLKKICHCSVSEGNNCTIDKLGPLFPGQKLQADFCIPSAKEHNIVHVETHGIYLPDSTCNIAQQSESVSYISNLPKAVAFTVVSNASERCELFLIGQEFYDVFYVELLPCPVGFTLQDGICDCDPYLSNSDIRINTCYIDQSTITRPANTWITAHNYSTSTKYLVSCNCPMDYCLPHSSYLNLRNPDLQCQSNRTGILCSQCPHSLSMVFGSSRCIHCTNIHILITLIIIVAGIVLVVLLYLLNLTVTDGTINGIIFYANIISINDSVFLVNDNVFNPLRVFISFVNLDVGIETCFYNGMDGYAKMFLQLFFPFYLIVIAISIIVASTCYNN